MTDDEIRRLVEQKSEGPNLDYKEGFAWTKENRDKKYELIRDLIAMANTKDGGRVIFGVRDADWELVGVSEPIYESVDPSSVGQMLAEQAAPQVRVAVFKRELDGKKIAVFDVAEFDDSPIICMKTITSNDGRKRTILRQAASYIRTNAATTEEITSPDDVRSLIARATTRKADELLTSIRDLLTGKPSRVAGDAAAAYAREMKELDDFFGDSGRADA